MKIACTLSTKDQAAQSERWRRLGAGAFASRETTADGLRLAFHDLPGVRDELRALVAVERECCAWATWDLDGTVLDVRSTGYGVATLHEMFTRLAGSDPGQTRV